MLSMYIYARNFFYRRRRIWLLSRFCNVLLSPLFLLLVSFLAHCWSPSVDRLWIMCRTLAPTTMHPEVLLWMTTNCRLHCGGEGLRRLLQVSFLVTAVRTFQPLEFKQTAITLVGTGSEKNRTLFKIMEASQPFAHRGSLTEKINKEIRLVVILVNNNSGIPIVL